MLDFKTLLSVEWFLKFYVNAKWWKVSRSVTSHFCALELWSLLQLQSILKAEGTSAFETVHATATGWRQVSWWMLGSGKLWISLKLIKNCLICAGMQAVLWLPFHRRDNESNCYSKSTRRSAPEPGVQCTSCLGSGSASLSPPSPSTPMRRCVWSPEVNSGILS